MYKILNKTYSKLPSEEEEQREFVLWLKKNKILHFAVVNENKQSKDNRTKALRIEHKSRAMGKRRGVCDLFVYLDEYLLHIELKRQLPMLKNGKFGKPKNDLTDDQREFLEEANKYKYTKCFCCFGCDEAIRVVKKHIK